MFDSFRGAVTRARMHGDLYFAALLEPQPILEAFGAASSLWQGWIYTPAVTVWVFLSQRRRRATSLQGRRYRKRCIDMS